MTIELMQVQDVFHTETLAKFMMDLSPLKSNVPQKMWLEAIRGYMTTSEERTYGKAKDLFNGVDQDGNGLLDMEEVRSLFESMEMEVTDEQHAKAYAEMDDDGNGEVDFDEFHEWYAVHQHSIEKVWKPRLSAMFTVQDSEPSPSGDGTWSDPWVTVDIKLPLWARPKRPNSAGMKMSVEQERAEALNLFKEIDLDHSGALDTGEIKHLSSAMGANLSDEEALWAMKAMGSNGEQEIDFESFFLWWQANQSKAAGIKLKLMSKVKLRSRSMLRSPERTSRPSSASSQASNSASRPPSTSSFKDLDEVRRFFDHIVIDHIDDNGNG